MLLGGVLALLGDWLRIPVCCAWSKLSDRFPDRMRLLRPETTIQYTSTRVLRRRRSVLHDLLVPMYHVGPNCGICAEPAVVGGLFNVLLL